MPRSPSSPSLVLVPTEFEAGILLAEGDLPETTHAIVGFGVVAAAARTAALLAERRPSRVLLVGIAGTYDEAAFPTGAALAFSTVAIHGIGAGEGETHRPARELGFAHWEGDRERPPIGDRLPLSRPRGAAAGLLTVCAAAADAADTERRRARHPDAVAEDMEGFAVAVACFLADVPLGIVRGASNRVGDRDKSGWCVREAVAAARDVARSTLAGAWELD